MFSNIAIAEAWKKCRIVHCDISISNIVVTEGSEGVLIDWEFAIRLEETTDQPVEVLPSRTVSNFSLP